MKVKNHQRIPVSVLSKFAKSALGRSCAEGESLYDYVSEALILLGVEPIAGASAKRFVFANRDSIIGNKPKTQSIEKHSQRDAYAMTDAFLQSYEWRRLRMQALKMHGAVCQCCGANPKTGSVMNVDHIKPRKLFPELALELTNLQILCHECNHGKGNWDMTDWRTDKAVL